MTADCDEFVFRMVVRHKTLHATLIQRLEDLRLRESGVGAKGHALTRGLLALDLRHQQLVPVLSAVNVARPEFYQAVAVLIEQKQRVVADWFEVPAVRTVFLRSMHRTLAGVHVEHDAIGAIERLGLREHVTVHGHQPDEILLLGQQLGLEPMQRRRQRRAAVPPFR